MGQVGNDVDLARLVVEGDPGDPATGQVSGDLAEKTAVESGHAGHGENGLGHFVDELTLWLVVGARVGKVCGRHWTRGASLTCWSSSPNAMSWTVTLTSVTSRPVICSIAVITFRRMAAASWWIATPYSATIETSTAA